MHYLTIASCTKNEEDYIIPFIRFHRFLGCQKFIFWDRTFEPLNSILNKKDFPDVEIIHFPEGHNNVHAIAWAKSIKYAQGKTKWLACIDLDQAIVPVKSDNICDILKDYEQYASLQLNWSTFGSGGQDKKSPEPLFERFFMRAKLSEGVNNHTQFICQPTRALAIRTDDPHHAKLQNGEISVNTNKQVVKGPFNIPPLHDTMWVAHYINKSREEFLIKNAKGRADIYGAKMPMDMFENHEAVCNVEKEERVVNLWNKCVEAGF